MPVKAGISTKNPGEITINNSYLLNISMVMQDQEGTR